jgi:hypothetical protein
LKIVNQFVVDIICTFAINGRQEEIAMLVNLTCSAKPRPSVQKGAKGNQWWKREAFHVQRSGMKTLCGRDCSEWLRMEPREAGAAKDDPNCCSRCAAALSH